MQGLFVRKKNPQGISGWGDLARRDLTIVNRKRGTAERIILDQQLIQQGISAAAVRGYTWEAASPLACLTAISQGKADMGCGSNDEVLQRRDIGFVPLQQELCDLVFRLEDRDTPAIRAVFDYARSGELKQDLELIGGYDTTQTGRYREWGLTH
jgi:putative molybdopterin biosynthesis protein